MYVIDWYLRVDKTNYNNNITCSISLKHKEYTAVGNNNKKMVMFNQIIWCNVILEKSESAVTFPIELWPVVEIRIINGSGT